MFTVCGQCPSLHAEGLRLVAVLSNTGVNLAVGPELDFLRLTDVN
jgi:hypothetical protein